METKQKRWKKLFDWKLYATVILCVGAAFAVRSALDPLLKEEMHFTFFWLAAVGAMWRKGYSAAALTSALGYLVAIYYFISPRHTFGVFSSSGLAIALIYFGVCIFTCFLARMITRMTRKGEALVLALRTEAQERTQAMASLQKTETMMRQVLDALPIGVWILNEKGEMTNANPAGIQIWGGTREHARLAEYKGRCLATGKALEPHDWASVRALKRGDISLNEEIEIESFDGTPKVILNSAIPIRENGKIVGAIVVNQDITGRKQSEEELRKAKESLERHSRDLEGLVAERTARLNETVHSLEGVLYHIAHDLRAPLRAMQGYSTLLLQNYAQPMGELAGSYLGRIAEAANRMDALIQDLLTYGRISREEIGDDRIQVKLLVEECIDELRKEIEIKRASIRIDQPMPELHSSRSLLHKVFCALLSNAIRFSRPGVPPEIRIFAVQQNDWWRICVQDNGIGIQPQYKEKIFQLFEKADEDTGGCGMGLAITQKAVQRLGGRIRVDSEPGKGSRFWIDLPDRRRPMPANKLMIHG